MPAQFCKEVLSLGDEQILYTNEEIFVDSPGPCATDLALAIAQSMDVLEGKQTLQRKENSRGSSGTSAHEQTSRADVWKLVPFKRTNQLCQLESKLKSMLKGRIKVLSDERTAMGDFLHRHVISLEASLVMMCCLLCMACLAE